MKKFRRKQKKLFSALKALVILTAVFLAAFIGLKPIIADFSSTLALILSYFSDILVVATLIILFVYYSKYGKIDAVLTDVENEINDAGFYLTSREEKDADSYIEVMCEDLKACGYSINKNREINEFEFQVKAVRKKELFYILNIDNLDRNDILAYLDAVIYDITALNVKRRGNAVLCFVTDTAQEDAVSLSKMITSLGKKGQIKIALAIAEMSTSRVYFLGNQETKCRRMIANFVMNCDVPIKDKYINKERLPYQDKLEEKMESFNLKDFNNGDFFVH